MTGFVLLRVRAHRLLVAAALLSSLLVTTALASLAAYAHTTAEAGVRRALEHQSASRTVLTASARVEAHHQKSVDAGVRAAARRAYDGLPVRVEGVTRSASYALPGALHPGGPPPADHPDLTLFASLDPHRVRIVDGHWPTAAHTDDDTVPAALPVKAAKRLGLHTGDDLRLTSRLSDPPVHVRITGLYRPEDLQSPYWKLDPLEGEAVRTLDYTSYGPLAVTRDAFAGASLPPSETYWLADGDFSHVDVARLPALRDHFAHAVRHFSKAPHTAGAVAQSELPDVLAGLRRSLLSNRSTLLVAALQLVFLAVLTLLLVAQLLTSERTAETETLQARGASRSRLAAFSALEALLIALPGALLGPLLAVPLVHLLLTRGVLARSGVDSAVQLTPTVWCVAAAAAAACALTVVLPSLRRPATSDTKRRRRAGAVVRGGVDLALVVLAAVALWQLLGRSSGSGVLSTDAAGDGGGQSLGIDPVLVVAPALALLAGTVLALRLLPLIARLGERRAARGPGLAAALAGWQLARRPGYGSGPTLLLVLAVAMAVLAVGEGASWDRSQTDQAAFRTGGDITAVSSTVPSFGQGGLFTGVDGVSRGVPVARDEFTVHGDRTAQIVATDTRAAAPMLHVRDDLSAEPLPALLKPLPGGRAPADTGVPLPAHTTALRFGLRLSTAHHRDASASGVPQLSVTLRDRYGVPYTFGLGELPADGTRHTLTLDLTAEAGEGGSPAAPLRLTRLSVAYQAPRQNAETRLRLDDLTAAHADGTTTDVPAPHGGRWQAALHYSDDQHLMSDPYQPPKTGLIDAGSHGAAFALHYATGSAPTPRPFVGPAPLPVRLDVSYGPPPGTGSAPLTAIATDRFLDSTGAHVGDPVTLQVGGAELDVTVTAALRALPTTDPARDSAADGGALLLDLGAVDQALTDADKPPLAPQSWWLKTAHGQTVHVAHALRENAAVGSVLVRDELADQLRSDPLTAGPRGALTAIALAAAVLAGAGCAVSAARAAEEREPEFAILRALGASPRRLARVLAAEQGVLLTLALGVGLLLGVLSTRLLIPLLVLTGEGTTARPEPLVLLPPGALAALLAAVLALPVLVAVGTALRRSDPMTALRTERGD